MNDLSDRQRALLTYLGSYIRAHGYPPSIREMARAVGIRSTNGVAYQLRALETRGYLERDTEGAHARAMRLTAKARPIAAKEGRVVPLVGRVAAGPPVGAEEIPEGALVVDRMLAPGDGPFYALRVKGESMVEDGILSGDFVVVRSQDHAREKDIVVAVVDGETTVKRLHRDARRWWLVPANRDMRAFPLPADGTARIAGVVVGLVRKLA
ncbi:MAG: transcriptional repressor LexA [Deltaproteobacteria bacterium]|nr:transcriptional repressor LexA [Deltaproteobacteria bacterium]